MTVGIPRAFLYYRYGGLWETFFKELGCDVLLSPETNKSLLKGGAAKSVDESCLSSKIYMGHIEWLIGKCDFVLIPRIAGFGKGQIVCTKFAAAYDVAKNAFRDRGIQILDYNVDIERGKTEILGFFGMGRRLKKKRLEIFRAYYMAKQREKMEREQKIAAQEKLLSEDGNMKILVVAHGYNIYDGYIGAPVLRFLRELNCTPVIAEIVESDLAVKKAKEISPTLKWTYNQELVGAIDVYKERVDGIILITSFPCGPDSLVNEIIIRRTKDKPIISLTVDEQDGTAGMETRLESFVDVIRFKREGVTGVA